MTSPNTLHLGIGLRADAYQLLRDPGSNLLNDLDRTADFLTLEDDFARSEGDGPDAIILANWLGARTRSVGILAGATLNVLEPFHVSTAIATLDYVTEGRAGLLAQPLGGRRAAEARRAIGQLNGFPEPEGDALANDFSDALEVIRRLWDSWEDDAVIRDPESQRFVDGSKLRYIDFKGKSFNVLGPSITPRPPQGQPVVATVVEAGDDPALAATSDIVFLRATPDALPELLNSYRRNYPAALLFADIELGGRHETSARASARRWPEDPISLLEEVRSATTGLAGIRFVPTDPAQELKLLVEQVLPKLRASTAPALGSGTLRDRLGLSAAANRYVDAA